MTFTEITQEIDFLCDTNSTSYPLADKTRNLNRWVYRVVSWILGSSPYWEYDDTNLTTLPVVRTNLVASQADYSIPTDLLRVEKATVLDSAGNENELRFVSFDEFKSRTLQATDSTGLPEVICMRGGSILLDPTPAAAQVTTTNGLSLYVSREIDVFTTADTTQEPGFAEPFHRIVTLGPASDFMTKYDVQKANAWLGQIEGIKKELLSFQANRVKALPPALQPASVGRQRLYR